ncbi:MAG: rhamnose ABC transporter substrate-binding protein, partial [Treponema sp.]|nr:rhamnose ABC transporter substrate-binding protein [Treponema sp.]
MKIVKNVTVCLLIAALALTALSCNKGGGQAEGSNTHAIVFKSTGNPYGERQMGGFEEGIKEQGGTAILRAPDLPTAEAQIQMVEQLIAQKVASICIVGND